MPFTCVIVTLNSFNVEMIKNMNPNGEMWVNFEKYSGTLNHGFMIKYSLKFLVIDHCHSSTQTIINSIVSLSANFDLLNDELTKTE